MREFSLGLPAGISVLSEHSTIPEPTIIMRLLLGALGIRVCSWRRQNQRACKAQKELLTKTAAVVFARQRRKIEMAQAWGVLLAAVMFIVVGVVSGNAFGQGLTSTYSGPGVELSEPNLIGGGSPVFLSNVPAYNWYHGCGPTAAASVIGYYDLHGFDNLFPDSGWDAVKLTTNVKDQISSPAHNAKYDPTPDNSSLSVPPNTSIACWFRTSVSPSQYGWSYLSYADDAFAGYITNCGYQCTAWNENYGQFTWQDLVSEVGAGRPMMFLVDTDGNGGTDHFVPVFGYDDRGTGGKYYGCYDTWSEGETVKWYRFRGMGQPWGVGAATFVQVVPEPSTLVLLGIGALALFAYAWRRRRAA